MSHFSAPDLAPDPSALVAYLDRTAQGLGAMKRYIVGAHVAAGAGIVLDVGCGVGHDLALLAESGVAAIGIDPSAAFVAAASARTRRFGADVIVVRAAGEHVPLRDASVDGARIERVLQHVAEPRVVLREARRCVRPGGLVTVFEPDWTTMRVASDQFDDDARWLANVRHPDVGAALPTLVEDTGAHVLDVVEEHSVWPSLARAANGIDIDGALTRSVAAGVMTDRAAAEWRREQHARDAKGTFRATITKRLVVARVP